MTAIACLRIAVGEDLKFADDEAMAAIVAKIAGAYLESTWTWPRRFGLVAPFAFVLADPRAQRLDAGELQVLARDLQKKLFGDTGAGDVCLLMIEGSQAEVMRFASTHINDLAALLSGRDDGAFTGRICRITPTSVESLAPPGGPTDGHPPTRLLQGAARQAARDTGWWGVYYLPAETFIGGGVVARDGVASSSRLDHDLLCIRAAREAIQAGREGIVFLPLDFSSIIRPSSRAALQAELSTLPPEARGRLAATVLDVPRGPTHPALMHVLSLVRDHVAFLDLRISDPLFRIETLPVGVATSVTLSLAGADDRARLSALKSFFGEQPRYEAKRIWQGVSDLSSPTELNLCRAHNAQFLSGPMISNLLPGPLKDVVWPSDALPYRGSLGALKSSVAAPVGAPPR